MSASDSETLWYFAYGSNMYSPRLKARVPSAGWYDVARLPGYCLAFAKKGGDGSAKCDIDPYEPATVWGVVYCIDADELPALDAAEGEGYERIEVKVSTTSEDFLDAVTYQARPDWRCEGLPYTWYRDLVVAGAREHGLPEPYTAGIREKDTQDDPDPQRAAANRL
jgi:cation transport regulator ChaC